MKIFYQWEAGSYHNQASLDIVKYLSTWNYKMTWYDNFEKCWDELNSSIDLWLTWTKEESILILAIENSYAWSIYDNLYKFLKIDAKIIAEYNMWIDLSLCSLEKDISNVKRVYSHFKALPQCYDYFKKHNISDQIVYSDTAWAAKMISETKEKWAWALCSKLAWEMYGLNVLDDKVQDQKWNTTRFLVIAASDSKIEYKKNTWKISILFEARDLPASLYKCLWAFATNWLNLTKIESLPNIKNPFSYLFWLDFEWKLDSEDTKKSLEELSFFTKDIKILWEY